MYRCIDLHTHSNISDGSEAPGEVYRLGKKAELRAVALTDHDTVAGLDEFMAAGKDDAECLAVPGVEISCRFANREVHIVGLFVDYKSAGLLDFLIAQRSNRRARNIEMLARLKVNGYVLSPDEPEFLSVPDRTNIGRPHFAAALMRKYGFGSRQEVFDKLIGFGKCCYVQRQAAECADAIAAVRRAGGLAVWAHPVYRGKDESAFVRRTARRLAAFGLEGIEGYYSLFGPPETRLVSQIAAETGLLLSGGSDFHGEKISNIAIGSGRGGLRVPEMLLDAMLERLKKRE